MKNRVSFAVLLVLIAVSLPSAAQKNTVDISLRGPWILYVDSSSFANYPVLIAMAPGVDPNSKWAHQPPTIGNGEAYSVSDPTQGYPPTDSQIYCLIFGSTCARRGASTLNPDVNYPKSSEVEAYVPGGQTSWQWVTASRNYHAPTLILPVPDSYGVDTVWPMRFGPAFQAQGNGYDHYDTYGTGVVLHYFTGPASFDLARCPSGPKPMPSIANCTIATNTEHTNLINTGALHIEMAAPAANWSCDPHVRMIYPELLNLLGTPAGPKDKRDWVVIDPAHDLGQGQQGIYDQFEDGHQTPDPKLGLVQSEYCLEHDSQGGYINDRWVSSSGSTQKMDTPKPCDHAPANVDPWIGCVQQLVKAIPPNPDLGNIRDKTKREVLGTVLHEIRTDGSDSALRFPRLSQLRRLDDNIAFLGPFLGQLLEDTKKRSPADQGSGVLQVLQTIFTFLSEIEPFQDQYTKTHGDCAAPVIHLKDN